ncbi:nitrate ABC transporter permease [Pseudoduganella danionis]|uniref:nitrate ABC transporter permease n=1 Tax=Pseudoduganella danionis TaxID=1890295 RepID=UPI0035AE0151
MNAMLKPETALPVEVPVRRPRPALKVNPAARVREQMSAAAIKVIAPLLGAALLVLVWQIITIKNSNFPTPLATWHEAVALFSDPFYRNSPNDQGIGWNILASLQRVAVGFGLAALVGIPLGFLIGRVPFVGSMVGPMISLLKPVSPLAWLPIGLLVFKSANPAAIWSIFICSIWPMIINTAVGVQRVPQDYMNVARVLNLSEWKVLTKILLPSALPYILTGVRLSIGTAWLVIVAAEMLTGGVGIGFWVWDEWNNLNVPHIIIAIVAIGVVGLLLEQALVALARAFSYEQVAN